MKAIKKEGYFKGVGDLELYWQSYQVSDPKAAIIFLHGLGEHSDRYQHPIRYFSERDYSLYFYDQRGHGRSEGARAYTRGLDANVEDLDIFVKRIKKKEKKVFLVGHSFGGQVVVNYLAQVQPNLNGALLSSPNIQVKVKVPWIKKKAARVLSNFVPRLSMDNELDVQLISKDAEVVEEYLNDPLVTDKITVRLGGEILRNHDVIMDLAQKIELPILLMHAGADEICDPEGSREFFSLLAAEDKTLKIYDGFYHEIFNCVGRETVFKDMDLWLNERI